jgi:hypothetical protein
MIINIDLDSWDTRMANLEFVLARIPSEPNADVELVSCRELLATGRKSKATGCRIK